MEKRNALGRGDKLSWWKPVLPPGVATIALVLVVVTLAVLLVAWLIILGCFARRVWSLTLLDRGGLPPATFLRVVASAALVRSTLWIQLCGCCVGKLEPLLPGID